MAAYPAGMTEIPMPETTARRAPPRRGGRVAARNREQILAAAERVFARRGFRGARLDEIAIEADLPKANLLYYFKTKEALYRAVITDILSVWNTALGEIRVDDDPVEALTAYVARKMALSRERPEASRVFAMEVISGAPVIGGVLRGELRALVRGQAEVLRAWQRRGAMADLPVFHVFFALWAVTQTYADFDAQVTAILGVDRLDDTGHREAVATVTAIVLRGLGVAPAGSAAGSGVS